MAHCPFSLPFPPPPNLGWALNGEVLVSYPLGFTQIYSQDKECHENKNNSFTKNHTGRRISLFTFIDLCTPPIPRENQRWGPPVCNSPLLYRWDWNEAHELQGVILIGQLSAEWGIYHDCLAQWICSVSAFQMVRMWTLDLPLVSMWPWQISPLFSDSIQKWGIRGNNKTCLSGNTL